VVKFWYFCERERGKRERERERERLVTNKQHVLISLPLILYFLLPFSALFLISDTSYAVVGSFTISSRKRA
jgi:hypothetical protein